MTCRIPLTLCLLVVATLVAQAAANDQPAAGNHCIDCHTSEQTGFNAAHAFAADACTACHAGDATTPTEQAAHEGMIAFPGNLDNAARACGACHANRVAGVTNNLMHTGHGMVQITRDHGALGAKLTGAGGGGSMIALCDDNSDAVAAGLSRQGFKSLQVTV